MRKTQLTTSKAKTIQIKTGPEGKETVLPVSLPHQWPFPFSNGKKVIVPKVVDKKKSVKQEYPEAPF